MKAVEYLTSQNNQEKYPSEIRQKIASILAQIVVFNERKNPALATKV